MKKEIKRVVIAGCRHFSDYDYFCEKVDTALSRIREEYTLVILSGHCSGVDWMAEKYAKKNKLRVELFPAEWEKYGKSAGPRRNREMVAVADYAIAFPSGGRGTKSLMDFAREKGIPLKVFPVPDPAE